MSKKSAAKRNEKKPVSPTAIAVVMGTTACELNYDEMLTELEAIVSEAGVRLAKEEASL
ncbi:MAG TPA: hypothetical protein VGI71_23290 [Scandinavium sp.]